MFFFFFNDTATTEIYTLSLHDALPIFVAVDRVFLVENPEGLIAAATVDDIGGLRIVAREQLESALADRKSTRLNSSHANISYAVFCLKKKKKITNTVRCDRHYSSIICR